MIVFVLVWVAALHQPAPLSRSQARRCIKSAAAREDTPSRRDEPRQPRNHEGMSASGNELPLDIGDDGNLSELFPTIGFDIAWSAASAGALAPRPVSSATSRAVAAALAARQALPVALGGLAIPDDAPLSRPSSAAPTPRAPQPLPELKTKWEVECERIDPDEASDVFCVRFSPDESLIAAGSQDGSVRILRSATGRVAYTLIEETGSGFGVRLPVTCLRWRPDLSGTGASRVLLTADASGSVCHWQADASSERTHILKEERNQVYALDFSTDAASFATAGKDASVRLYDEKSCQLISTFRADDLGYPGNATTGHSSRVFSLKFLSDEPHMLLSAGWDNTIMFWDVRQRSAAFSLYGPHVCGDSIDAKGDEVLAGSYKATKQLQLWDWRTRECIGTVPFRQALDDAASRSVATHAPCKLYAAQFSRPGGEGKDHSLLFAAGSGSFEGTGEVRVFAREGFEPLGRCTLSKSAYGLDTARGGKRIVVTGGGSKVRMLDVPTSANEAVELS